MLLNHLPRESAFVQSFVGESARWGDTEHLLAGVIDAINVGRYYTEILASNRQLKSSPVPPKPIRRPDDEIASLASQPKRDYTQEQMRDFLDNWNEPEVIDDGS